MNKIENHTGTGPDPGDTNPRHTAQQQAYWHIRQQILTGAFGGGAWVNPAKVADTLGLSRMPVREAIRQLDAEGLLTMRPNRGAVVTVLTPDDVEELFEMRAVLEALAVTHALPVLSGDTMEELLVLKRRMDRASNDAKLWIARHNDFHDFLCRQSGWSRLTESIARVRTSVQPYLAMYISVYEHMEMQGHEHDTLISAIESNDARRVELTVREHVLSAGQGVIAFLRDRMAEDRKSVAAGR